MRMLPFMGVQLFEGTGVFMGFLYFTTYRGVEVLPNVVAGCTIAVLVIRLLVSASCWSVDSFFLCVSIFYMLPTNFLFDRPRLYSHHHRASSIP